MFSFLTYVASAHAIFLLWSSRHGSCISSGGRSGGPVRSRMRVRGAEWRTGQWTVGRGRALDCLRDGSRLNATLKSELAWEDKEHRNATPAAPASGVHHRSAGVGIGIARVLAPAAVTGALDQPRFRVPPLEEIRAPPARARGRRTQPR